MRFPFGRFLHCFNISIIFFAMVSTKLALSCEYCASTTQECVAYEDVCTSSHQECTNYESVCDSYEDVCVAYEEYCDAYDDNGDCISYSSYCVDYETYCTSYSNQCTSWEDVCDVYESRCTQYVDVCESYYYGDYLTVTGGVSSLETGNPVLNSLVTQTSNFESDAAYSNSGGRYSTTVFAYDDAGGYLNSRVCAESSSAAATVCRNVSVYDSCTSPTVTVDFDISLNYLQAPYNLSVQATDYNRLTPVWNSSFGATAGFYVAWAAGAVAPDCRRGVDVGNVTSYTIQNLQQLTFYSVSVCAYDSNGNVSLEDIASQTTKRMPPPAPFGLSVSSSSTTTANSSWSSGGGSTYGFYVAILAGGNAPNCSSGTNVGSNLSNAFSGLQPGSLYSVSVCAYDAYGNYSSQISASVRTKYLVPPPPTGLVLTADSPSQLGASWTSGGGSTSGYYINYALGTTVPNCSSGSSVGNVTTSKVTGLSANTAYTIVVCSVNPDGIFSATSISGSQTTKRLPPPPPTGLVVSNVLSNQFNLAWTSGGGSTTGFMVAIAVGTTAPICTTGTNIGNVTTYLVSSLVPHTTYSISVCAADAYGNYSTKISATQLTKSLPAPVPTNLSFSGLSKTAVTANWISGGGSSAGFIAKIAVGNSSSLTCAGGFDVGTALTKAFTGLTANTLYTVAICAYNFEAVQSGSVTQTVLTLQDPPPAPKNLTITNATPTGLTATWASGLGNTAGYIVNFAVGNGTGLTCQGGIDVGNVTTKALTGLLSNTSYTVIVCAYNSPQHTLSMAISRSGKTLFALAPPVTGLVISANAATSLKASWTSGGGSTSGFRAAILAGTTAPACSTGTNVNTATNHTFSGLTPDKVYTILVCAYNGNSVLSTGVIVTGSTFALTPPAPKNLVLTVNSPSQITAVWGSNLGTTSGFKVVYAAGASAPACTVAGTDTHTAMTLVVSPLLANTTYSFAVCAYNKNGVYSTALTASAKTFALPPPAPINLVLSTDSYSRITANWTTGGGTTATYVVAHALGTTAPSCTGAKNIGSSPTTKLSGLKPNSTYAISVCAVNGNGLLSPVLSGTKTTQVFRYAINAGGTATGSFVADENFSGGRKYGVSSAIDVSKVVNPAPVGVYQSMRHGNFTYTIPNLAPGTSYNVRLHFAELYWSRAGKRLFNVTINGVSVLANYDIFAKSGGKNIAIITSSVATANAAGNIVITFTKVRDGAAVDGIEISSP